MEQATGFEPASPEWQPRVFYQLNYACLLHSNLEYKKTCVAASF